MPDTGVSVGPGPASSSCAGAGLASTAGNPFLEAASPAPAPPGRGGVTGRDRTALWLQTMRVRSLAIASIGVAAGTAVAFAEGSASVRTAIAWLGAVAIQAGTNLINVAHNYKAGVLAGPAADPRGSSAPVRAGLLVPERVRRAAILAFALGAGAGLTLVALCGWPILALGVPAIIAGWSYGAPPLRLAYRGLGVITVFIFMGPVMVVGSQYVAALRVSPASLAVSIPVGLLAAAIMHLNDLRDYATDAAHGKRTLATRLGRQAAGRVLGGMLVVAYLALAAAPLLGHLPVLALIPLVTAPEAIRLARAARTSTDPRSLNVAWFRGVQLHTRFGMLLVSSLILARLLPA